MQCTFEETIDLPDGGFQHTKCIEKVGILIVDDSCYGLCYRCAYNKLKIENKRLGEVIDEMRMDKVRELRKDKRCLEL